jgi:hypothetical protein
MHFEFELLQLFAPLTSCNVTVLWQTDGAMQQSDMDSNVSYATVFPNVPDRAIHS